MVVIYSPFKWHRRANFSDFLEHTQQYTLVFNYWINQHRGICVLIEAGLPALNLPTAIFTDGYQYGGGPP